MRFTHRRRWTIGDLMIGVVMLALAMAVVKLVAGSSLSQEDQAWFISAAVLALLFISVQWTLSSRSYDHLPFWSRFIVSLFVLGSVLAAFVSVMTMSVLFPEGSAVVLGAMVVLIIYLSTWV
jgi:hypothetical protein